MTAYVGRLCCGNFLVLGHCGVGGIVVLGHCGVGGPAMWCWGAVVLLYGALWCWGFRTVVLGHSGVGALWCWGTVVLGHWGRLGYVTSGGPCGVGTCGLVSFCWRAF